MKKKQLLIMLFVILIICATINARPQEEFVENPDPSWMRRQLARIRAVPGRISDFTRRQLMRMGETASNIGSKMGGFAVRLTNTVDRICKVIKKIIPIVGAVCTVGQFKFCALDNTTGEFPPESEISSPVGGPGLLPSHIHNPASTNLEELD